MALPKDIPTLCAKNTGNHTRVDQVFLDENLIHDLIVCSMIPSFIPPNTDHYPIMTTLMIDTPCSAQHNRHNFKDVDWEEFQDCLSIQLAELPAPHEMSDINDLQVSLTALNSAIQGTIEDIVPMANIVPQF
ncbi:hypothetical protein BDQ17DRAFT_1247947 [Cyathus striatus]|nr:hypothetical protein BDQ17DRAFT_1247947 [Cyathus striatus]